MKRLYFSGVVLPERAPLTISEVRSQVVDSEGNMTASIALNIYNNQVTAFVDTDESDISTVRNLVRSEVEFVTSVGGFLAGYGYEVEITKVFSEDIQITKVFGIDISALVERQQGINFNEAINAIFPLCYGELAIFLRRCLNDLSFAIKRLDDTAFYCFRAIESLRQSFGLEQNLTDEKQQWAAMTAATGKTKEDIEPLRTHAFPARHGIPRPLSDDERKELFLLTWEVVESYIDYRLAKMGSNFTLQGTLRNKAPQRP